MPSPQAEWENRIAERYRKAEERKKEHKTMLRTICMMLSRHKIKKVVISYDGQGDSGCVDEVKLFDENDKAINERDIEVRDEYGLSRYTRKQWDWKLQQEVEVDCSALSKLEDIAYEYLPSGWEINEGSYGEFVIHVEEGEMEHEHSIRVESIETESQTHEI